LGRENTTISFANSTEAHDVMTIEFTWHFAIGVLAAFCESVRTALLPELQNRETVESRDSSQVRLTCGPLSSTLRSRGRRRPGHFVSQGEVVHAAEDNHSDPIIRKAGP
jgi:hypothetical protein